MSWTHTYSPLGTVWISAFVASLPFVLLCWQLLIRKAKGHHAALLALACAYMLARWVWGMPLELALSATGYGFAFAAFPILWIVLSAMWFYSMTVDAGLFSIICDSISALTDDRRIQAVFIAFAFGALLESTAGYGSPVAIGAAMLIGLGFPPLQAAVLCLVANTVPVAYAGLGLPAFVAAQASELDVFRISQIIGIRLPIIAIFVPLWLSVLVAGWRKSLEIWPVLLLGGLGSAVPTYLFAQYHGHTLPGIMGAIGSLTILALVLRLWQPAHIFRFAHDPQCGATAFPHSKATVLRAWLPWAILMALIIGSSHAPVRAFLNSLQSLTLPWPWLDGLVVKVAPLATPNATMPALFTLNLVSSPGTIIFISGLLMPLMVPGYSYPKAAKAFVRTCVQMRYSVATVLCVLALAQLMNYSGMSYTLGLVFTHTGVFFPLFAPILGWIGVFLTGSDTSSNALFSGMQRATADMIGLDPNHIVAANSTGGVTAKMISPQSIAVAVGATNMVGQEGTLMRRTIGHSLLMLAFACLITWVHTTFFS